MADGWGGDEAAVEVRLNLIRSPVGHSDEEWERGREGCGRAWQSVVCARPMGRRRGKAVGTDVDEALYATSRRLGPPTWRPFSGVSSPDGMEIYIERSQRSANSAEAHVHGTAPRRTPSRASGKREEEENSKEFW